MSLNRQLPRSTPEEQGVSSMNILAFLNAIEQEAREKENQELHSFMLMRHGYVVAEGWWSPYASYRPHMLFSLSKSFTSTAIGFAVTETLLSLDDFVVSFFPEDVPESVGENLAVMRVRHLLSMSTGNAEDTMGHIFKQEEGNWVKGFLRAPVEHVPGTHFVYNTGATYMLSAILQKVTGQMLIEYLQPRLFKPLGIEGAAWDCCPRGINTGGFGLNVKTEDIAKFGQLYLQKGVWNGKQILPEAWVEEATASHISNGTDPNSDWSQGYGYQFWRCCNGAYRGDGAFGQYCVVLPEKDAVIAITGAVSDMQIILNLIWKHLLPSMKSIPFPTDVASNAALESKLNSLAVVLPGTVSCSQAAGRVSGNLYELEPNGLKLQDVSFTFTDEACIVTQQDNLSKQVIRCGIGKWVEGKLELPGVGQVRVTTCGTWHDENTFHMILRFVETPFYNTVIYQFDDDSLRVEVYGNVSLEPIKHEIIKGRMVK
jgi:CubicO group peptidase (beta-lactamase class C family)